MQRQVAPRLLAACGAVPTALSLAMFLCCDSQACCRSSAGEDMQREVAPRLLAFWAHFQAAGGAARTALSVRDLLAWARFISAAAPDVGLLPAYAHGAYLVLLDGIGLGLGMPLEVCFRSLGLQLLIQCQWTAAVRTNIRQDVRQRASLVRRGARWGVSPHAATARTHLQPHAFQSGSCSLHLVQLLQAAHALRARCHAFLLRQLPPELASAAAAAAGYAPPSSLAPEHPPGRWGLGSFTIERGPEAPAGAPGCIQTAFTGMKLKINQWRSTSIFEIEKLKGHLPGRWAWAPPPSSAA